MRSKHLRAAVNAIEAEHSPAVVAGMVLTAAILSDESIAQERENLCADIGMKYGNEFEKAVREQLAMMDRTDEIQGQGQDDKPTTCSPMPAFDSSAAAAFNLAALVLPKRVLNEDLGDAMEQINTLVLAGSPRWQIWLKIITSILWALWSAVKSPSASTHKAKK